MAQAIPPVLLATALIAAPSVPAAGGPRTPAASPMARPAVERADAHWTPRRMMAAVKPAGARPPAAASAFTSSERGALWAGGGAVSRSTGKVFYTVAGRDRVCSASAVRSANRDVVVTAAHCVRPRGTARPDNWIFVPGYRDGRAPYGGFTARRSFVPDRWSEHGDGDFDVAMVVLATADGRHVVDAAGGLPIAFGGPHSRSTHVFGYPAEGRYDGERLAYCSGRPSGSTTDDTTALGLGCDLTHGSSGGPWLTGFDPSTGTGTVSSVSSFRYAGDGTRLYGVRFGPAIDDLYHRAQHS